LLPCSSHRITGNSKLACGATANHRIIESDVCDPARARKADLFKSRTRLEAENLFLRHQLTIALRQARPRLRLRGSDRALLIGMTLIWPSLGMTQLVQPETILRSLRG
jgi:hypothetical protein